MAWLFLGLIRAEELDRERVLRSALVIEPVSDDPPERRVIEHNLLIFVVEGELHRPSLAEFVLHLLAVIKILQLVALDPLGRTGQRCPCSSFHLPLTRVGEAGHSNGIRSPVFLTRKALDVPELVPLSP